jgi:hypothetical protein
MNFESARSGRPRIVTCIEVEEQIELRDYRYWWISMWNEFMQELYNVHQKIFYSDGIMKHVVHFE